MFYRREDGHGQQALQENHVGWKWSVPGVDESEAGQETERQADGKEKWPGQKEEGYRLVSRRKELCCRLLKTFAAETRDHFTITVESHSVQRFTRFMVLPQSLLFSNSQQENVCSYGTAASV